MANRISALRSFLVLLLPLTAGGCLLAAGAAAGGGGVYFTSRGAESIVQGSVGQVTSTTQQAFQNLAIEHKGQRDSEEGDGREVYGAVDDGEVTVTLERRTDNATKVEATVRRGTMRFDKDMARRILEEIRELRGE